MSIVTALALVPVVLIALVALCAVAYLALAAWCVSGDPANTPEEDL